MNPVVSVTARELQEDQSARLWALVMHLAEHPQDQHLPDFRPFWLAYIFDAQVNNGGHLQYFHNCGSDNASETISALILIGAKEHANLLASCLEKIKAAPIKKVESLHDYPQLAAERSFKVEDSAYYSQKSTVLELLEKHYQALLLACVQVRS